MTYYYHYCYHSSEVLANFIRQEKEIIGIRIDGKRLDCHYLKII